MKFSRVCRALASIARIADAKDHVTASRKSETAMYGSLGVCNKNPFSLFERTHLANSCRREQQNGTAGHEVSEIAHSILMVTKWLFT